MKKFLTVLLAVAVVFTFSFGSTMAFAADEGTYDVEDWIKALQAEKTAQLSYLANAKAQALAKYEFNNEGFVDTSFAKPNDDVVAGYSKAALEAAADAVIEDRTEAIDKAIRDKLESLTFPTTKPEKTVVSNVTVGYLTAVDFKAKMEAENYKEDMVKAQAPLTKKLVEEKLDAVDATKYNSKDKAYNYNSNTGEVTPSGTSITAADAIRAIVERAMDAVRDGENKKTDGERLTAYEEAYLAFKTEFDKVKTLEDENFGQLTDDTNLTTSVDAYAAYGYELADDLLDGFTSASTKLSWADKVAKDGALNAFWDENSKNSKDGKLFGVDIKDKNKVTRTEASAVYTAMKNAITESKTAVKAWADAKDKKNVAELYANDTTFYATLDKAMNAAEKYADVVKEGDKLKKTYTAGVKQYNNAKVDEAVKKAEKFVYADLSESKFADALDYIKEAANDINDNDKGLANLKEDAAKFGYENFIAAVDDAAEKMYKDGLAAKNPAEKVSYGADKTPEADLVYLKGTYADGKLGQNKWNDIAADVIADLKDAQSYDEINAIMKKAAEDFGKLLKKDDETDVNKAKDAYEAALKGFIEQNYQLLDSGSDYSFAYGDRSENAPLYIKGAELIDDATTVDGVKAAYAEAQALVTGAKSNKELKDMKKAVEKQIDALPLNDKLTAADLDTVKAAYKAFVEYKETAGSDVAGTIMDTVLKTKYDKVNALVKDAIDDEAKALLDKLNAVNSESDEDMPKYIAYKAEVKALVEKGEALLDDIKTVNDDNKDFLSDVDFGTDYDKLKEIAGVVLEQEGNMYMTEVKNAANLLIIAAKPNATAAQMKAALDAFNALTQRQQLLLDQSNPYYFEWAKAIAEKVGTNVKELKITAKSTAKKGSITVKWTVKGDASTIDGYQVWKSTKHSKGYKKAFTTKKQTYKNTKGLKKGVRYYYKVRAYKVVDGKNVYSDWSNKARRVAK